MIVHGRGEILPAQEEEARVTIPGPLDRLILQIELLVNRVLELSRERAPPERMLPAPKCEPPPPTPEVPPADESSFFGEFLVGFFGVIFGVEEAKQKRKQRRRDRKATKQLLKRLRFWS